MKIFQTLQKYFDFVGIDQSYSFKKFYENTKFLRIIFGSLLGSTLSIIFLISGANDFRDYAECYYINATCSLISITFSQFLLNTSNIFKIITDFETAIEQRSENSVSKVIFIELNEKIEKLTKIAFFVYEKVTTISVTIPFVIMSYIQYFTSDLGNEAFRLPFTFWFPFEWRDPYLYLLAIAITMGIIYCVLIISVCVISFWLSTLYMFIAFAKIIKQDIGNFNEINKTKHLIQFKERISAFIQFHAHLKQLVNEINGIYNIIVTNYFLWSILTICSTLLVIQIELLRGASMNFVLVSEICMIFWSFFQTYIFCQSGEIVTSEFMELNEAIYELDWYSFPPEIQRVFPTLLINAQQPVVFKGFGNVMCTCESYQKVVNAGYSYFSILRKFRL